MLRLLEIIIKTNDKHRTDRKYRRCRRRVSGSPSATPPCLVPPSSTPSLVCCSVAWDFCKPASGLFRPFSSMCCASIRDRRVAGEAYVSRSCMCFLIRCKMGPGPLRQGPPLPASPSTSVPSSPPLGEVTSLSERHRDGADWSDFCHFMAACTGSRCTVPKQVFMLPARRGRRWRAPRGLHAGGS